MFIYQQNIENIIFSSFFVDIKSWLSSSINHEENGTRFRMKIYIISNNSILFRKKIPKTFRIESFWSEVSSSCSSYSQKWVLIFPPNRTNLLENENSRYDANFVKTEGEKQGCHVTFFETHLVHLRKNFDHIKH